MKNLFCLLLLAISMSANAQVSVNTDGSVPDNSAMLDVKSTTKGILIPRMTMAQRNAIANPANGLMIYQTDNSPGYYYNSGTGTSPVWVMAGTGSGWGLTGNSGTNPASNFIGTTDNVALNFRVNNQKAGRISPDGLVFLGYQVGNSNTGTYNTGIGHIALTTNTTGSSNTACGAGALALNTEGNYNTANGFNTLYSNTTGYSNTAYGAWSLASNNTGVENTACGFAALFLNTIGAHNTATGVSALFSNTVGQENTANGFQALYSNTTGTDNLACGMNALYSNTSGNHNIAIGNYALYTQSNNISNGFNIAIGYQALYSNQLTSSGGGGGFGNTAVGHNSLQLNTTGFHNNGFGTTALYHNLTGIRNTACGSRTLEDNTIGSSNTAVGNAALMLNINGSNNTGLGADAGVYSSIVVDNGTAVGFEASVDVSNKVRIGNISVSSIGGQVGWTNFSDARIKKDVKENVPGLEFIKELRPVTYHFDLEKEYELYGRKDTLNWDGKYDIEKIQFSGFLAQEVEEAATKTGYDFSGVDNQGIIMGLRYAEFTVPLVKAVQELNAINESQKLMNEEQRIAIKEQKLLIEEQKLSMIELKALNEKLMQRIEKLENR